MKKKNCLLEEILFATCLVEEVNFSSRERNIILSCQQSNMKKPLTSKKLRRKRLKIRPGKRRSYKLSTKVKK